MTSPRSGPQGRAARWRKGNNALLGRLSDEQLAALRRAATGYPPAFILGWHDQPNTGTALGPPLLAIEDIARELLRGYGWPAGGDEREWPASGFVDRRGFGDWHLVAPDWRAHPGKSELRYDRGSDKVCPQYDGQGRRVEGRPDFRRELLTLIQLVAELRAAAAGGHTESAMLRAMTIGALFTRVATMTLNGADIASSAGARAGRDGAKAMRDDRLEDSRSACEDAILRFDAAVRAKNKYWKSWKARAEKIEPLFAAWAKAEQEKPLGVRQLRRILERIAPALR